MSGGVLQRSVLAGAMAAMLAMAGAGCDRKSSPLTVSERLIEIPNNQMVERSFELNVAGSWVISCDAPWVRLGPTAGSGKAQIWMNCVRPGPTEHPDANILLIAAGQEGSPVSIRVVHTPEVR